MNRVALWAALAVAGVGTLLLFFYMQQFENEVRGGEPIAVLAASRDIEVGTALTSEMLVVKEIPERYWEKRRHIRQAELSKVIGMRITSKLNPDECLLWTDLATADFERRQLATLVRRGMRAMTIKTSANSTFGRLLRPGDRVDILMTGKKPATNETVTISLLQNILVLAVGSDIGSEKKGERRGSDITMAFVPEQANMVVHALSIGELQLVMRNVNDIQVLDALPEVSADDLIEPARRKKLGNSKRPDLIEKIR